MSDKHQIAVLPGDGIGPEVVREGLKILSAVAEKFCISFDLQEGIIGGAAIDKYGKPLPQSSLDLAKNADAVVLGAVGGPKWENLDYRIRPERALLGLRNRLELYANLRPAKVFSTLIDASSLKKEVIENTNIMIVRELVGGIYFGKPKGVEKLEDGNEKGVNTLVYTTPEIKRIAKIAFEVASKRKKKVLSVDKANVLESTELWRKVVTKVHADYQDIELSHMYVDNCAMQLVKDPKQFDVIVTTNMFGDILSDEAAMLTGSIGMLPSASLGGNNGMYEPIHGSAPDIAGRDIANPIATIMSIAMMFKYSFGVDEASEVIESAVEKILQNGYRTKDIMDNSGKLVGTKEMGDLILKEIQEA
ncbi:MAG: 3-isopropylmalate dehydrogenase [Nitrospinota bacterium]|nr:3-isopropylmalate dehydrogenase [Nitrospinota bacterium]MDP7581329.1 3-isopropylmalate dehydrogenase [Nitrospinota bacterium]HJN03080.1 3-isopropylmalate dehydrogenase [Nitrospinota bacterium]